MLVRMYPDVIGLKPAALLVLAGTNDIARNTGSATPEMIQQNIMAMTELAQHQNIKILLCPILPVGSGPVRQRMTVGRPLEDILKLNAWMKRYAAQVKGLLKDGIANDGLHPNPDGYKILAPIASGAIERALM